MLQQILNHFYQIFINIALRALDGVDWVCKKYAIQPSPPASEAESCNLVGNISCGSNANGHIETYPTEETPPSNKDKRVKLILDLSVSPTKEVSILSATKFEVDLLADHVQQPQPIRKFVEPAFSALEKLSATMRPCLEKTLNEIEEQIKIKPIKSPKVPENRENSPGKGEIESNRIILSPKKRLSSTSMSAYFPVQILNIIGVNSPFSDEIPTDDAANAGVDVTTITEPSTSTCSTKPRTSISSLTLELPESQIEALNKSIEMDRKEKSKETRKRKNISTSSDEDVNENNEESEEDSEPDETEESVKKPTTEADDIRESLKSLLLSEEDYESAEDPDYQLEEQSTSEGSTSSSEDLEATKLEAEQTVLESLSMNIDMSTDMSGSNSYHQLQNENEIDGDKSDGDGEVSILEITQIIKTVSPAIALSKSNQLSDMEISNEESPEVKFIGAHSPNQNQNQGPIKNETNCSKSKSKAKSPCNESSSPKVNAQNGD